MSCGSSPLTRGKHYLTLPARPVNGLIPAHAGKTALDRRAGETEGAHPRSRGENDSDDGFSGHYLGSSPLTRGKQPAEKLLRAPWGLIPAHAGKTGRGVTSSSPATAHPRSRGENKDGAGAALIRWGSSPLTRGKLRRSNGQSTGSGLIPAHAGKTRGCSLRPCRWRAHPRSRGENRRIQVRGPRVRGSSPLTRGKRRPPRRGVRPRGLIPAHAGKTAAWMSRPSRPTAHPRSRGENTPWLPRRFCV